MEIYIKTQVSSLLPPEQSGWFLEARRVYLQGDIGLALSQDEKLLTWAHAQQHLMGRVLAHRFIGLCYFRKDTLDKSAEHLRQALDLAGQLPLKHQVFLCANHLAATLRRQGKLFEAYDLLREHLKQAKLPTYLHERARLYGNYGALLDQLGQRAAADDCYSRMEELCELLDNADRLANARGLAARSADLRQDSETALQKYYEERELANQSGNAARQIAATLHMARMSSKLGRFDEAEQLCAQGLAQAQSQGPPSRLIDAWECRAEIAQRRRQLAASYAARQQAISLTKGTANEEKRANNLHRLAVLCHDAGLHGDALYHLKITAQILYDLFEPLRQNERVYKMARDRFLELHVLARELVQEAKSVARGDDEKDSIKALIQQILNPHYPDLTAEQLEAKLGSLEQNRSPEDAAILWREQLLPGSFSLLCPESQKELSRFERTYSASVDDLQRCIHLLTVVVERELRDRIIIPARKVFDRESYTKGRLSREWSSIHRCFADEDKCARLGLGTILDYLDKALNVPGGRSDDFSRRLQALLLPHQELIRRLAVLNEPVRLVDGSECGFSIKDLRNAVAHGEDARRFPGISRLTVDAVKRTLVLDKDPPLLAHIARLQLQSGPLN